MKTEKDLFAEIQNVLHTHEDGYVPGAWEEFVKKKKRRRGIIFIRMAAAAVVLLLSGYAVWLLAPGKLTVTENHQTKIIVKPPYIRPKNNYQGDSLIAGPAVTPEKNNGVDLVSPIPLATAKQHTIEGTMLSRNAMNEAPPAPNKSGETNRADTRIGGAKGAMPGNEATSVVANVKPSDTNAAPTAATNMPSVIKTAPKRYDRGTQRLNYDSLANLNKPKPFTADDKKSKNLSYALMVSPSVGNQKMNFGTGIEVAYNINKSFSVSSGVSYAYINAGSNRNAQLADGVQNASLQGYNSSFANASSASSFAKTTSSQSVQGVKLALSGFEIPLSFQYKTTSGFFVSAGVSAMSVIGNDLSYQVVNNRAVSTPSANGLANTISVVSEQVTEKSNEKLTGYVGFYTLSAGKKINFGRGKLNFAPFIKIPFNRVSSENIQLIHGGVQLGFGF